jgi:citrate lyase gamma subunit
MIYGNAKCFAAKKLVKHGTIAENYAAWEKMMIIASPLSKENVSLQLSSSVNQQ